MEAHWCGGIGVTMGEPRVRDRPGPRLGVYRLTGVGIIDP